MIDARVRFRRLLEIESFHSFCETVCAEAAGLTRCAIAVWDDEPSQRTARHMFHGICTALYGEQDRPGPQRERCDACDLESARAVVRNGVPTQYLCWAGFTCEMVPILVNGGAVGLISIGEFFTEERRELSAPAREIAAPAVELEAEIGKVPVLSPADRKAVRSAVEHLAGILADLVTARINPQTLPDYLVRAARRMGELWRQQQKGTGVLAAALDALTLVHLANLFFSDVRDSLAAQRDLSLHQALSPLNRIASLADGLPAGRERSGILAAVEEVDRNARLLLAETDVLRGTWWKLTPEPLSARLLGDTLEQEYRPKLDPGDELHVTSGPGAARVDPSLARRFGRILLDNALKAVPAGRRRLRVRLRVERGDLLLQVEDNGCGIPGDARSRIFERGFRCGQPAYGAGHGMGLHELFENLRLAGGAVVVEESELGGALIRLRMPGFPAGRGAGRERGRTPPTSPGRGAGGEPEREVS